ncbi:retrovirus-related pol polyprotein from transposon TNT 1-94, partial [Tanacetum coccineum]
MLVQKTSTDAWTRRYFRGISLFSRYLDTKSNGEYLRKCIFDGPYMPTNVLIAAVEAAENILPVAAHEEVETIHNMTAENKLYFQAEKEAIFLILTGIGDEIYSTVDACNTAKEMWTAIERLQQGESLNVQDVKTNLFWEFGKFTSRDGESMESYYSRFYKLMNELTRNNLQVSPMQVNVQFLQQLQPEWSRFVTVVKQRQEIDTVSYHKLFDVLKQFQNEVNDIRSERLARSANPLALLAAAQPNPDNYYQAPKPQRSNAPCTQSESSSITTMASPIQSQRDQSPNPLLTQPETVQTYQQQPSNFFKLPNNRTEDTTPKENNNNDNQSRQFGNQRTMTVAGARETVGSPVVQQNGIQCFNCKGFGHYARECRKPKRVKDYAYTKEKCDDVQTKAEQGKSLETQFDKPSVVRQPNAQRIPKPSVLGKPTPFSNSPGMRSFQTKQSVNKTNVSDGLFKPVTQQSLPQNRNQAIQNTNVHTECINCLHHNTKLETPKLLIYSRNTNPHMSKSSGVIHTTSVSRPQLKSYQVKDKVVPNISQVKFTKKEVEDNHRISSISKKTKSVTACNDSLNSRTSNVNAVCADCGKCVFNSDHDACRKANKSVATPHKKTVASDTTIQKSKSYYKELYENTNQEWKWWIAKRCPTGYTWTQKPLRTKQIWMPKIRKANESTSISPTIDIVSRITNIVQLILFIVDSGCTKHMTGNLKLCVNFVEKFSGYIAKPKLKYDKDQPLVVLGEMKHRKLNKTLHAYFKEEGIEHQTSTPRTPEQNGVVERQNRTLVEAARTMLSASKLPLSFWAEAVATACYTQNRSIIISTHGKTAYHIINDRKPSIKHLHIFGCICYITRDGENLDKMKEKGDPCVMVGYSTQSKGYRVYNKRTRLIVETIHIKFDEIKEMMSDHNSSDLAPQRQEMSVENVTSGLVPQGQKASDYDNSDPVPPRQNVVPKAKKIDSSQQGLKFLFSPLLEEYYNPAHGHAEDNNNDQVPNASFQE